MKEVLLNRVSNTTVEESRLETEQIFQFLTASVILLFSIAKPYNGEPRKYKAWIRELELYAMVLKISITYVTCSGQYFIL